MYGSEKVKRCDLFVGVKALGPACEDSSLGVK